MWHSVGKVVTVGAGTPVQVTSTRTKCQTVFFQTVETNTGKLYILDRSTGNFTTGVGLLATIPAPTLNAGNVATTLPWAAVTIPSAPGPLDVADFYIDGDNAAEVCVVSYVRP